MTQLIIVTFGPQVVIADEFADLPGAECVLVYGSWAARYHGRPGPLPHDVDVLVIGGAHRGDVYDAADRAEQRLGFPSTPPSAHPIAGPRPRPAHPADPGLPHRHSGRPHHTQRGRGGTVTRWSQARQPSSAYSPPGHLQTVTAVRTSQRPALWDKATKTLHTLKASSTTRKAPTSSTTPSATPAPACSPNKAYGPTRPEGGQYAVEEAIRAQFGSRFKPLGTLRRRRNELEYPLPGDHVDEQETRDALTDAYTMLEAASKLLPHLDFFHRP